jgi:PRC-barrel domain
MDCTKYRNACAAAAVALALAGGSTMAVAQNAGQQQPEWQQYDKLDDRFGPLAWLTFGEVIGAPVVDKQGEPVGEIIHLVRAKDDGMFYAVVDAQASFGEGDQVVPVDHFEVVGDDQASRKIVLVGESAGDFDASDFDSATPSGKSQQQG